MDTSFFFLVFVVVVAAVAIYNLIRRRPEGKRGREGGERGAWR